MSTPGHSSVGRYELRERLGAGGMGTVWRAWDPSLQRDVAIKEVLLPQGMDPEARAEAHARTLREAQATARISNTAVVTVHDVLEHEDSPWIVMELLSGKSLQYQLDHHGPMPVERVEEAARSLLGGLRAVHAGGVTHRDVKPANIMLTEDDRTVLTDFGIANVDGGAALTQTGVYIGSPEYMAPERFEGKRALPASDLWSLGVTLYALLEGRSPFKRESITGIISAVLTAPMPPRLSLDDAEHSPASAPLRALIAALLARDASARPSPDEALALLEREKQAQEGDGGVGTGAQDSPGTGGQPVPLTGPQEADSGSWRAPGTGAQSVPGGAVPTGPSGGYRPPFPVAGPGTPGQAGPGQGAPGTGPHPPWHAAPSGPNGPGAPQGGPAFPSGPHTPHGPGGPQSGPNGPGFASGPHNPAFPSGPHGPGFPGGQTGPNLPGGTAAHGPGTGPGAYPQAPHTAGHQPAPQLPPPPGATGQFSLPFPSAGTPTGRGPLPGQPVGGPGHPGMFPGHGGGPATGAQTPWERPRTGMPATVVTAAVMLVLNGLYLLVLAVLFTVESTSGSLEVNGASMAQLYVWGLLSTVAAPALLTRSRLVYGGVVLLQMVAAVVLVLNMFTVVVYAPEQLPVYVLVLLLNLAVAGLLLIPARARAYFGFGADFR
ncbi:serine/threonine protein kinase [Nocardiopsis dassonvillei]|uniref:serine/threonine protein kinase n=1 Tax=Nocardiopsis dassonvillei TaxID=2014 RepID=UPI000B9D7D9E|nr:serine/threonine protein kinase [Nocardiopsis dassonvillei]ASU56812.1 serine/threonine protein kinase [Nocardiopsis dassonvillei]